MFSRGRTPGSPIVSLGPVSKMRVLLIRYFSFYQGSKLVDVVIVVPVSQGHKVIILRRFVTWEISLFKLLQHDFTILKNPK